MEIESALAQNQLGILSLARGSNAYAFPLFYRFHRGTLYFHGHPGEKDHFIRATEEACLSVVRALTTEDWHSVMAFGPVRAVAGDELDEVREVLGSVPAPPTLRDEGAGEDEPSHEDVTYWKLKPTRVTGRKSQAAYEEIGVS